MRATEATTPPVSGTLPDTEANPSAAPAPVTAWFRRRSFGGDYAGTIPKWHIRLPNEEGTDTKQYVAACEYEYYDYYGDIIRQEEQPTPPTGNCRKCMATIRPVKTEAEAARGLFAIVRFPSAEEQARGMLVVPRYKRMTAPTEEEQ